MCFGKLVADRLADFHVGLADKIVGGCEPGKVGHSLQVPHDDAWFHDIEVRQTYSAWPYVNDRLLPLLPPAPQQFHAIRLDNWPGSLSQNASARLR